MNSNERNLRRGVIVASSLVCVLLYVYSVFFTPLGASAEVRVEIKAGDSLSQIAENLKDNGIIRSTSFFKLHAFFSGSAHELKQGVYFFDKGTSIANIIKALVKGPEPISFLIPEGRAFHDIEHDLVTRGLLHEGDFSHLNPQDFSTDFPFLKDASSFEGFLFPDTYEIMPGALPQDIMKQFLKNFSQKALPILQTNGISWSSLYKKIILASLLEREVKSDQDRRMVAGIIANRLKASLPLQIDATVLYAACNGTYDGCLLTKDSFSLQSPYNTYVNRGLPPTPIANPGAETLKAAFSPISSSYLYYLTDPKTGKTYFSTTFEDHSAKRARYLQ